jgi:cytochrome c5
MNTMKKPALLFVAMLAFLTGYGGTNDAFAETPDMTVSPDLVTGERVYKSTCSICHQTGLRGAPRMGRKQDWEQRLAQDREILYDHAINGYRGKKGNMPSRGSNIKLTVEEVKASVDYMIENAIPAWTLE